MSTAEETLTKWFTDPDPGDWVGIFENQDLGHPDLGMRIAGLYGADQWDLAEVGKTTGPDGIHGLGWRYILAAKTRTFDEALEELTP